MSQILFTVPNKKGKQLRVVAGYDRPLSEFFLHVCPDMDMAGTYYNGDGPDAAVLVADAVKKAKLAMPEDLASKVIELMQRREGNVTHILKGEGWFHRETIIG